MDSRVSERKGDENPRLSAEWLMSEATGLSRIELYVNFERPLTLDERAVLRDFVARRGKGGATAAYQRQGSLSLYNRLGCSECG